MHSGVRHADPRFHSGSTAGTWRNWTPVPLISEGPHRSLRVFSCPSRQTGRQCCIFPETYDRAVNQVETHCRPNLQLAWYSFFAAEARSPPTAQSTACTRMLTRTVCRTWAGLIWSSSSPVWSPWESLPRSASGSWRDS